MTARRLLPVVCLVVLAGCGAVPFADDAEGPETVTPVPVETTAGTPAPTVSAADLPPGVDTGGRVDGAELGAAHSEALGSRSYTWTIVSVTESPGGESETLSRRVTVDDDAILLAENRTARYGNVTVYLGDPQSYLRLDGEDGTRISPVDQPLSNRTYAFAGSLIEQFLDGLTVDPTLVEREGREYVRLRAIGDAPPNSTVSRYATVRNYSATAYVARAGFVRTLAVEYEEVTDDGRERSSFRFDYGALGATTVTEPDWAATARAETPTPTPRTTTTTSAPIDPMPSDERTERRTVTGPRTGTTPNGPATDE